MPIDLHDLYRTADDGYVTFLWLVVDQVREWREEAQRNA